MSLNAPIETDQLILRPVRRDDLPALNELKTDPAVTRYLPYPAPPTPEQLALALNADLELAASSGETLMLGIQRLHEPSLIGHVAIWPRRAGDVPRGELIIMVSSTQWRHGVGAEACAAAMRRWTFTFDSSEVYAAVHPENLACQALMRKIGLDHEAEGHALPGLHSKTDRLFWRTEEG